MVSLHATFREHLGREGDEGLAVAHAGAARRRLASWEEGANWRECVRLIGEFPVAVRWVLRHEPDRFHGVAHNAVAVEWTAGHLQSAYQISELALV